MQFHASSVIHFWFTELSPKDWWVKSDSLDNKIKSRFLNAHLAAKNGELSHWRNTAHGRLAEIIVLDQFSRNIYRDTPQAFSQDSMALVLSQELIANKFDLILNPQEKLFAFLPFMHSESVHVHQLAVKIFEKAGLDLDFELKHKIIIDKFGRYPHRNSILNRTSTTEEEEFLKGPNSSF